MPPFEQSVRDAEPERIQRPGCEGGTLAGNNLLVFF